MKPFEIFRAGRHRPVQGEALAFGESDLATTVAGYDPARHEAPIVVGHPTMNAPAYGWVEKLELRNGSLVAHPHQVDAAFAELVQDGRYKKVSASFYLPDAPANPTPGAYYLRHVGFLGASPPSLKGLKQIEFAAGDEGTVSIEFADWTLATTSGAAARLFRRVRDWMIEKESLETADQVLPSWELESLDRAAADASTAVSPGFSEPSLKEPTMTDKAELDRRDAELTKREVEQKLRDAAFAEKTRLAHAAEDLATVEATIAAGRLPIGLKPAAIALFAAVSEAGTVDFAEVEGGAAKPTTPRALLASLLGKLPTPVHVAEIAGGKAPAIDFADPLKVAEAITVTVQEAAKRGETLSGAAALGRLQQGAVA